MGFRLTSLHVSSKNHEAIWRLLRVRPSGLILRDTGEGVCGCAQADGSYLIVARSDEGRHADKDLLRALSTGADLLVCQIHEGCMWSQAAGWQDGRRSWSVEHAREVGPGHLDIVGTPPSQLEAIRDAREARQATEKTGLFGIDHIFDIAPALYAALTGYRYDRFDPTRKFEVLLAS